MCVEPRGLSQWLDVSVFETGLQKHPGTPGSCIGAGDLNTGPLMHTASPLTIAISLAMYGSDFCPDTGVWDTLLGQAEFRVLAGIYSVQPLSGAGLEQSSDALLRGWGNSLGCGRLEAGVSDSQESSNLWKTCTEELGMEGRRSLDL